MPHSLATDALRERRCNKSSIDRLGAVRQGALSQPATSRMPQRRTLFHGRSMRLVHRWKQFHALSSSDRLLLVRCASLLAAVCILIRLLGYRHTERILASCISSQRHTTPASAASMASATHLGELIRIAGNHLPMNATCLRQSLLLWWLLRLRGLAAELRIGVDIREGFAAHAWVELDGCPVNDTPEVTARFAVLELARS